MSTPPVLTEQLLTTLGACEQGIRAFRDLQQPEIPITQEFMGRLYRERNPYVDWLVAELNLTGECHDKGRFIVFDKGLFLAKRGFLAKRDGDGEGYFRLKSRDGSTWRIDWTAALKCSVTCSGCRWLLPLPMPLTVNEAYSVALKLAVENEPDRFRGGSL